MDGIEKRLEQVHQLIAAIKANRDEIVAIAVRDTGFTRRECNIEIDIVLKRLQGFDEMVTHFAERQPMCGPEQEVALVLPYNGSAWLNTAIISIYMVGNRVRVKFASLGSDIARLTESLYQDIFGDKEAQSLGKDLVGEPYCHQVSEMTFGCFGTVAVNQSRAESWAGAFVSKPVGGYGYSGWIWETVDDRFILKQGPKLLSLETSIPNFS